MPRKFNAKYPGRCGECPDDIDVGDEVTFSDDVLVHVDCAGVEAPPAPKNICPQCNLAKPCEHDGPARGPLGAVQGVLSPEVRSGIDRFVDKAKERAAAPVTMTAEQFFSEQPVKIATLEEQVEESVKRDQWGRPLIVQADGSKKPYNRASSYGGQIEDTGNIARWQQQQVLRGVAMHPELLDRVPDVAKGDPWAELGSSTKKGLTRIAEQAQEYAGSNLKSALGTQIHAATEFVDLGDSLEDKFAELDPARRKLLIERGNAYHRAVKGWGLTFDSIEDFGVQDELQVAGTWDRRGFVPWWPEHRQTIIDVKTSSSLDFAGVGFSVQLATYSRMCQYVIDTAERIPHEDMNPDQALIIHVDRKGGGPVTLAKVDVHWGWQNAVLARKILVARREGKGRVAELDQREARILTCLSRAELGEMGSEIVTWPSWLREIANERWKELS